jgi:hypothetical protein
MFDALSREAQKIRRKLKKNAQDESGGFRLLTDTA